MLRINQLKLPVTHTQEQLEKKLIKTLKINRNDMKQYGSGSAHSTPGKSRSSVMCIRSILR